MDKRGLALGTLGNALANVFRIGLQLVMLPLMARLLGPDEYGLYALAFPTIMFVMTLADGGFGASLAREPEHNQTIWSSAFWALLCTAILLSAAAVAWSFPVARFTHQQRLPSVTLVLSLCILMYVLGVPSGALLLRRAKLAIGALAEVVSNAIGAIVALTLAYSGAGVWSVVAQTVVIYAVKLVVLFTGAPFIPLPRFALHQLRPHLTMGGAIVGSKLVEMGDRAIENALVGRSFGAGFLGLFSLSYQISRFLVDALLNPLWLALYVQSLRADDETRFRTYHRFVRLAALALFPMATLVAADAGALIDIFLGPRWLTMSPLFQAMLLTYALGGVGGLGSAILFAKGHTGISLQISVEAAAIRVVAVVLAPLIGVWVLWIGISISFLYSGWRLAAASCRSVERDGYEIVQPLLIPGICAILSGSLSWASTALVPSTLIFVIAKGAGGFCIYIGLLLAWDRQTLLRDLGNVYCLLWRTEPAI